VWHTNLPFMYPRNRCEFLNSKSCITTTTSATSQSRVFPCCVQFRWNPVGSVRLSLSGRQLKSPTPKTMATYRSSTGAIDQSSAATATKSRCWSLLVADEDLNTSKTQQRDCMLDDTSVVISNMNVSGFLETDLDEDYHPPRIAADGDHRRRSLVAPADSGDGNIIVQVCSVNKKGIGWSRSRVSLIGITD